MLLPTLSAAAALVFLSTSAAAIILATDDLDPASVFAKLNLLGVSDRQTEYSRLPIPAQHVFWVGKLEDFKNSQLPSLNEAQLQALERGIALAANLTSLDNAPEVRRAMTEVFDPDKTRT
jgi:hypothetical protein